MALPRRKSPNHFSVRWRIVSMSAWQQDFIDEEEEGCQAFGVNGQGEFQFGCVHGHMDCRPSKRDGDETEFVAKRTGARGRKSKT